MEKLNSQTTPGRWKRFPPSHLGDCSPALADVGGHGKHHVVGDTTRDPPPVAAQAKLGIVGRPPEPPAHGQDQPGQLGTLTSSPMPAPQPSVRVTEILVKT